MTSRSDPSSTSADRVRAGRVPADRALADEADADQVGADRALADRVLADTYRSEWGRLLSLLVTRTRRLDLAEDALGEAFARAGANWRSNGVPANPAAWLHTTARRVIIGRLRSEAIHGQKASLVAVRPDWSGPLANDGAGGGRPGERDGTADGLGDERLALILLCCHPALHPGSRSPLALRLVIGTTTDDIARLFLVPRSTMAARITRAKKKIVAAGIPLSEPVDTELQIRLDDVCRTIYLAFTAGYAPGSGDDLLRADLAGDGVELAAVLHQLVPDAAQVTALLGLLLVQHARRDARVADGRLITLSQQDRSLWHRPQIEAAVDLVSRLPPGSGYAEELRLQALIAVEHGRASVAADTDWATIAMLYDTLEAVTGSPIVRLNRAVAVGEADGPAAGLLVLDGLGDALGGNHRLSAVRADLARRAGDIELAREAYNTAIQTCANLVERQYLMEQLRQLDQGPDQWDR